MGRSIGFVAGGIGDQIYHLTQLRALAGISQTGTIDIACITPGPMSRILAATPWVGRVIDARPIRRYLPGMRGSAAVRALRLHRYDSAFILHRSTSLKLAAAFAGIRFRAGLADSWLDRLLLQAPLALSAGGARRSVWGHRPFIAAIDEYLVDLGLVLDEDTPTILPDRSATSQAKALVQGLAGPVVIVNLFVHAEGRRWPLDAAMDTLAALAETTGGTFILNAGPDAAEYHREAVVAWHERCAKNRQIKKRQLIDSLGPEASMERDIALYHLADAYLGVDSFTANLAMNCNLPAVILFAAKRDRLAYRSRVVPLAPEIRGDLRSLGAASIAHSLDTMLASRATQPLPV
ncbi:MAG: hypothetical protein VXX06_00640 [Pseudomonadota bacterium]|nr:hypothetical protein [Pseudomonadota bacterium]